MFMCAIANALVHGHNNYMDMYSSHTWMFGSYDIIHWDYSIQFAVLNLYFCLKNSSHVSWQLFQPALAY